MPKTFHLDIVTPERLVVSEAVEEVIAPGSEGDFGVLAGHANFLSTLRLGELAYKAENGWRYLAVTWGFAEVSPDRVTVLAEAAEPAEELREGEVETALAEATRALEAADANADRAVLHRRRAEAELRHRVSKRRCALSDR